MLSNLQEWKFGDPISNPNNPMDMIKMSDKRYHGAAKVRQVSELQKTTNAQPIMSKIRQNITSRKPTAQIANKGQVLRDAVTGLKQAAQHSVKAPLAPRTATRFAKSSIKRLRPVLATAATMSIKKGKISG